VHHVFNFNHEIMLFLVGALFLRNIMMSISYPNPKFDQILKILAAKQCIMYTISTILYISVYLWYSRL